MTDQLLPDWVVSEARTPDDLAADTKSRIAKQLRAADPTAQVEFTDYFNHTYLPDMVLRWPRAQSARLLYIRSTDSPEWLASDVDVIAAERPLVLAFGAPLEAQSPASSAEGRSVNDAHAVDQVASSTGTAVISPWGVTELATKAQAGDLDRLVSHLTLSGGRGLTNRERARDLSEEASIAFEGARAVEPEPTADGARLFAKVLNPQQASQAVRLLHAIWVGSGGAESNFPASRDPGLLSAQEVELLLQVANEGDDDFWKHVGDITNLEEIEQLFVPEFSAKFNSLVAANLGRLIGRALAVQYEPHRLTETERPPYWLVQSGRLALRAHDWTAYIARKKDDLPKGEPHSPQLDLSELRARTLRSPMRLSSVESSDGDISVSLKSASRRHVLDERRLAESLSGVTGTRIKSVVAAAPGGGALSVDFAAGTASGVGKSRFELPILARIALALLLRSTDDQWPLVEGMLPIAGPQLDFDGDDTWSEADLFEDGEESP